MKSKEHKNAKKSLFNKPNRTKPGMPQKVQKKLTKY